MLEVLNTLLWGPGTLALILGTGAWLTLRTGGFPQRNLGRALTLSLGREARRKGRGGVSPFGSLMTALASTVGTGNIVGVAAALVSGGPGALVWMELAALLGLAAKFAECMLAVKYRRVRRDGTRWGGPMAVMETRLGSAGAVLGRFYALFALLMAFAMGAMTQSGALADTFSAAFTLPRYPPYRGYFHGAGAGDGATVFGRRTGGDPGKPPPPAGGGDPDAPVRSGAGSRAGRGLGDRHPPGGPPLGRCPERFFQRGGVRFRRHHRRLR